MNPAVSRRAVLRSVAGLSAATMVAACTAAPPDAPSPAPTTSAAPPPPDALQPLAQAARADAATATAAATATPARAAQLGVVAAERTAHALALEAEIARAAGSISGTPVVPPATTTPGAAPPPPASFADLLVSLRANQQGAGALAITVQPYRAGLLGSVAAACAAQLAVLG